MTILQYCVSPFRNLLVFFVLLNIYLLLISFTFPLQTNDESPLLIYAIKSGNLEQVKKLLNPQDVNSLLAPENYTPLIIALKSNQPKIVKFLVENGANPNLRCHGRTPLMFACQVISKTQIKILLAQGANINETDSAGTSSLMIAAAIQPSSVGKILIRHGASLNLRNKIGFTARDYSIHSNNKSMTSYLRTIFERRLPNYFDGPYATFISKKKLEVSYLKHDSLHHRTIKYASVYDWNNHNHNMIGINGDNSVYEIFQTFEPEKSTYNSVEKVFVIGDIHGQCDSLKKFLINNKIIDKDHRWCFGNGHLLFVGDIFDRGETVTEALWLIYRLEQEAKRSGGMVHLILGNHEIMTFTGDARYVADKYIYLFKNIKTDYQKSYSNKSVLGRWLKSKNTIIKINNILFVHGGIHPDLLRYKVSTDSINHLIYHFLNAKRKKDKPNNSLVEFLFSINGPFWYRGMIQREQLYGSLNDDNLNQILKFYEVNKIMVGHSYLPTITPFYNSKVYGLDVPFYLFTGSPMEGLFIDSTGYYRTYSNGSRMLIESTK